MEFTPSSESPTTPSTEAASSQLSLLDQVVGIFISPAEVFEDVRRSPARTGTWLIPLIVFIVISVVSGFLIFGDTRVQAQIQELTSKKMEQMVREGKLTPEQAQRAEEFSSASSGFALAARVAGQIIVPPIAFFLVVLVYFLGGKLFFKTTATFAKTAEVVGVGYYVLALEVIVTTILVLAIGSMYASPSAALAISSFDPGNKIHVLLSKLNVFTVWYLVLVSIGLARIFERRASLVSGMVFGFWIVWVVIQILLGGSFG